jgi:hypothetical protein
MACSMVSFAFFAYKFKGRKHFEKPRRRMKDNIKIYFKATEYNLLTVFKCLGTGSLARCCQKGNKLKKSSTKYRE